MKELEMNMEAGFALDPSKADDMLLVEMSPEELREGLATSNEFVLEYYLAEEIED